MAKIQTRRVSSLISQSSIDYQALNSLNSEANLFDVDNVHNAFSDVQIKVGRRTFYCHKLVLQLNSSYFANLAFPSKAVMLQGINPDQFYDILRFMYTKEVSVTMGNIESLLSVACILGINDLMQICLIFIDDRLNRNDARINNYRMKSKLALVYKKMAVGHFNSLKNNPSLHLSVSEEFMKVILSEDNLEVKSEVEVCEMLMKWLQVQTEALREVHPDQLLPLIRWSGISVNNVKAMLFQNNILISDPASISFLSKVIMYLLSGIEFEGLQTFHRPSTGLENCLLTVGTWNGYTPTSEVFQVNLRSPDSVTTLKELPTNVNNTSTACSSYNTLYITGTGGASCKEIWKWDGVTGWTRCPDLITGRGNHCATIVDSMLYVLGGKTDTEVTTSVDRYNTNTNKWSHAGNLTHAVRSAACIAYKKSIYVFGGRDADEKIVDYVQIYNPTNRSCEVIDKPMPSAHYEMRSMLWETSAILLDNSNCYIFNFENHSWQERTQFKADGDFFACTLNNNTVYIAGGTCNRRDKQNKLLETCTNEIRSVSVLDIVNNKPAVWIRHAELPKSSMIVTFGSVTVPSLK